MCNKWDFLRIDCGNGEYNSFNGIVLNARIFAYRFSETTIYTRVSNTSVWCLLNISFCVKGLLGKYSFPIMTVELLI